MTDGPIRAPRTRPPKWTSASSSTSVAPSAIGGQRARGPAPRSRARARRRSPPASRPRSRAARTTRSLRRRPPGARPCASQVTGGVAGCTASGSAARTARSTSAARRIIRPARAAATGGSRAARTASRGSTPVPLDDAEPAAAVLVELGTTLQRPEPRRHVGHRGPAYRGAGRRDRRDRDDEEIEAPRGEVGRGPHEAPIEQRAQRHHQGLRRQDARRHQIEVAIDVGEDDRRAQQRIEQTLEMGAARARPHPAGLAAVLDQADAVLAGEIGRGERGRAAGRGVDDGLRRRDPPRTGCRAGAPRPRSARGDAA